MKPFVTLIALALLTSVHASASTGNGVCQQTLKCGPAGSEASATCTADSRTNNYGSTANNHSFEIATCGTSPDRKSVFCNTKVTHIDGRIMADDTTLLCCNAAGDVVTIPAARYIDAKLISAVVKANCEKI